MTIAMLNTVSTESNEAAWNIGDNRFDSIVSTAAKAMEETSVALAYALSQAFDNANPNKLNDFMHSDLCTKGEITKTFAKKMLTWDAAKRIEFKGSIPTYRKQVANGGALLAYLRHYHLLSYTTKDPETGNDLYVDGPLTYSKGKFSYTKDNENNKGGPSKHWRSQLDSVGTDPDEPTSLEEIYAEVCTEKWWQFLSKGNKTKLNVEKRLATLAKSAIKAADDPDEILVEYMSEQTFIDLARKAYQSTMAAMAQ